MEKVVDIKVRAQDDSAPAFDKAGRAAEGFFARLKQGAREVNLEARQSGDTALERILKGGGAAGIFTLGAEEFKKLGDSAKEAFDKIIEGGDGAGESLNKVLSDIPIFGKMYEAASSVRDALEDGSAAFLKWAGASDEAVRSAESYDTQIKQSEKAIKDNTEAVELLSRAKAEHAKIAAEGLGKEAEAIAHANTLYAEQIAELEKKKALLEGMAAKGAVDAAEQIVTKDHQAELADIADKADKADKDRERLETEHQKRMQDIADSESPAKRKFHDRLAAATRGADEQRANRRTDFSPEKAAFDKAQNDFDTLYHYPALIERYKAAKDAFENAALNQSIKINQEELAEKYAAYNAYLDELNKANDQALDKRLKGEAKAKDEAIKSVHDWLKVKIDAGLQWLRAESEGLQKFNRLAKENDQDINRERLRKAEEAERAQRDSAHNPSLTPSRFLTGVGYATRERGGVDHQQRVVQLLENHGGLLGQMIDQIKLLIGVSDGTMPEP